MRLFTLFFVAVPAFFLLLATAANADDDHPLLPRYPGADLKAKEITEYQRFDIPLAEGGSLSLTGDLARHFYKIDNVSTLKVYQNYRHALEQAGFSVISSCELDECGAEDEVESLGETVAVKGLYNFHRQPYYLVAQKDTVYVALFIGGYNDDVTLQQVVVKETPKTLGLVEINGAYLESVLSAEPEQVVAGAYQEKDHKLLPRYPGADLKAREVTEYQSFAIPLADGGSLSLTGDLARHFYRIDNVSTLKVYQNYRHALEQAGFTIISSCELKECGNENQVKSLGEPLAVKGLYNFYREPYFLVAQKDTVYVALFIGGYNDDVTLQQVIIEETAAETGLVSLQMEGMKRQIDETGRALIYGIYFDTNKAVVKESSQPTMEEIAKLLKQYPQMHLYVVGHTDDTGDLDHNLRLSQQRAEAVVASLTNDHDIAKARLSAKGVGPFAPAATNESDSGKAKNRRVELVKRLTDQ